MTAPRQRLPNRRLSESFNFEVAGLRYTATVSRFADGRIGELFLSNHKFGNQSDTNARDAAVLLSFALQHAADIDTPAHELRKLVRKCIGRHIPQFQLGTLRLAEESEREVLEGWVKKIERAEARR